MFRDIGVIREAARRYAEHASQHGPETYKLVVECKLEANTIQVSMSLAPSLLRDYWTNDRLVAEAYIEDAAMVSIPLLQIRGEKRVGQAVQAVSDVTERICRMGLEAAVELDKKYGAQLQQIEAELEAKRKSRHA